MIQVVKVLVVMVGVLSDAFGVMTTLAESPSPR